LGLDEPAPQRYLEWLGGVITLDFGTSLALNEPVATAIRPRLLNSLILVIATFALLVPLSIVFGVWTAIREGSRMDLFGQVGSLSLTALPEFVVAAALIILFAFVWPVLPAISLTVTPRSLVLPTATLVLVSVAWTGRLIRAGVIEALRADHVAMARLKGLPERLVVRRHVLPQALGPSIQAFALTVGYIAGGVVVVESVFAFDGMGRGLVTAAASRDIPMVQAYTLILACFYIFANLIADLLTMLLNPQLRAT
jgi:peptide/nickel transport system permease protein